MEAKIGREQFEATYAAGSGMSVAFLHENNRCAIPCDPGCDYEGCQGWQMARAANIEDYPGYVRLTDGPNGHCLGVLE